MKIRFVGYKRLASTGCNTDGRIMAFVGANESGKSSLLEGLVWLTNGETDPLPVTYRSRSQQATEGEVVVEAEYELDSSDLALLTDLDVSVPPSTFLLQKRNDGTQGSDAQPILKRNAKPFEQARLRLQSAQKKLSRQFASHDEEENDDPGGPSAWSTILLEALSHPDKPWPEDVVEAGGLLAAWLDDVSPTSRSGSARDPRAAELIRAALDKSGSEHPRHLARRRLLDRVPKFVLFEENDRALSTVYSLEAVRDDPPAGLANLLRVAKLDLTRLWTFVQTQDGSSRESYIEMANENLTEFFSQAWNQSNVSVRLKCSGALLEVWLKELGRGGAVTNIEERSDGLRTFVALASFLASQQLVVPPILLIDEAETHLHYDAQADLVGILLKQIDATQVFYTTHSPGCLPGDLGTSIRLLRKDASRMNASQIRADFWTNEEPGFAPLLYAMGASAAAFSACRRAVLAEGAADMVLLPTLLRMATSLEDLDYQVAPGLSNAHTFGMRVEEVAAKVVYLTDGDAQGESYRSQLTAAGVDPSRIFSLPAGQATEDLIERAVFVHLVNPLLPDDAHVVESDLNDDQPIAKSLQDWGKRKGVKVPGHVAIAYGLVNRSVDLRLAPEAREQLVRLHEAFSGAFA